MQKGAIYGLLFPLAQFHLGVAITPATKAETDVIDLSRGSRRSSAAPEPTAIWRRAGSRATISRVR